MSLIDTLINIETEFGDVWISKDLGAQIIAALKAGQDMRMATNVKDTKKAYAAWDAAINEGEV